MLWLYYICPARHRFDALTKDGRDPHAGCELPGLDPLPEPQTRSWWRRLLSWASDG